MGHADRVDYAKRYAAERGADGAGAPSLPKNTLVFFHDLRETRRVNRFPTLAFLVAVYLTASSSHAADSRQDFLKLINRPRVSLNPKVEELPGTNGLTRFYFSFASDASQRVPGFLIKSASSHGRRPVVIALHGTGGSKTNMLSMCRELANRGFIAVAIDGRYHGERALSGKNSYQDAIVRAWHGSGEYPFFYDTVWDVMRLVDYLETRDDVDVGRIGLIGISKGGIETYLTAAADPRIAAAVPCIGVESFHWALDHNDWQGRIGTIQNAFNTIANEYGKSNTDTALVQNFYDRVAPGIYNKFDGPAMVPLIAPRPLLIISGDADPHCPLPGVNECLDVVRPTYHSAGADDHLTIRIQEHTGHKVNPESEREAMDWFVKQLKP